MVQAGQDVNAKALVVARGGKIWARGTDCCPIIFTDASDPLDGTYPINTRGQWGGLIILGKATNNLRLAQGGLAVADGVGTIEGLVPGDSRNHYGAALGSEDDDDNSGELRYVSVRHGGTDIGANNEINGITLGSVGRGTKIEFVEVISNDDDGIEFFGGTVDLKHAVVQYCNDDYIDWDQGYSGRIQFVLGVMLPQSGVAAQGDEGMEIDGDDENSDQMPLSNPDSWNITILGRGANRGVLAKERTQGRIANSIFVNFAAGVDLDDDRSGGNGDAYDEWLAGNHVYTNNCFDGVTDLLTIGGVAAGAPDLATFNGQGNVLAPGVIDWSFAIDPLTNTVTDGYDPVPDAGTVTSSALPPVDNFFDRVNYKGAFKPGATPWTEGWTLAAVLETDNSIVSCPEDINGDGVVDVNDFLDLNSAFGDTCGN